MRRKTEGRQFRRTWENWEIGEIVRKQKGEKRKQTERKRRTRWSRERSTTIVSFFSKPGVFAAFLSSCRMRWYMLVCKKQKENIRKPTPGITSCNTLFFLLFHSRTARKVMNSVKSDQAGWLGSAQLCSRLQDLTVLSTEFFFINVRHIFHQ